MLHQRVNGYDIAYITMGEGASLVCVHGTLGDFRVWCPVIGPLSQRHWVVSLSLRHFFPERWDGAGADYTIDQHVADVIGFIEALGKAPVNLMGHSRGGHIAFRVAQQRPDLLRRLVLAEPTGELGAGLAPGEAGAPSFGARYVVIAEKVAAGHRWGTHDVRRKFRRPRRLAEGAGERTSDLAGQRRNAAWSTQ